MTVFSLFRAILSCCIGLVIGVIFAAVVNLVIPMTNLTGTLTSVCLAAFFSALAGYMVGARQKK